MKVDRALSSFIVLLSLLIPLRNHASAAQINVVWTSEVGQFAPLWVTKELIHLKSPHI